MRFLTLFLLCTSACFAQCSTHERQPRLFSFLKSNMCADDYAKWAEPRLKDHWYKDTRRYATQVVRMILSYNPLRIFMPLGLTLMAIGTVKLIVDLFQFNLHVAADTLLILFAAFQVIAIGLLADLVTRATRNRDEKPPASI